ncbi:unnamed protein product, partial [Mesorhabditis belari]|uniref:Molybdopterin synthase catalytic subunit n=1 Tax=Mesorhabditis belari TaxID=2138241 RepID=A0AAF3EN71_9BILA
MKVARSDKRYVFIDMSSNSDVTCPESIVDLLQSFHDDLIRITFDRLDVEEAFNLVRSATCGATSVFLGTTRDNFNGKEVSRLDYESYDEMAYKEMRQLCAEVRRKFPTIERIVFWHRVGEVPVEETSVIVAAASPHREEAIQAVEMGINKIKRRVTIWKKEVYTDGGCVWKENGEWRTMKEPQEPSATEEHSFAVASRTRNHCPKLLWLQQLTTPVNKMESQLPNRKETLP